MHQVTKAPGEVSSHPTQRWALKTFRIRGLVGRSASDELDREYAKQYRVKDLKGSVMRTLDGDENLCDQGREAGKNEAPYHAT